MLKWLALLIGAAHAQTAGLPTYLIYPNAAACLVRSQQQCQALGCDGVNTIYWWDCSTGPLKPGFIGPAAVPSGAYAMRFDSGPFAVVHPIRGIGLTATEQAKVVTSGAIAPLLPPPSAVP